VDKKSIWHNYKGKSRFNMLFGDGHVEFYSFPNELANWTFDPKPDRNWKWW
jgi:prepilin-type processing-associated H-X9-DG protein